MKIAILGATSEIAKDLIRWLLRAPGYECVLFARRPDAVATWQAEQGLPNCFPVGCFNQLLETPDFDAIINFVGVGNPALAAQMGASILDVTASYDDLALAYVKNRPACRYIFLSSGAVYGENFDVPVTDTSRAIFPINDRQITNWYSVAKFYAEMRHRALSEQPIIDIRVFNYISRYQNVDARFLLTDMIRAIKEPTIFKTSTSNFYRDYLSPVDFCQMIACVLNGPNINAAIDCFTKAPVDKHGLLNSMSQRFGLVYEFMKEPGDANITGLKPNYFSTNHLATELFGYTPQKTALEAVIEETDAILNSKEASAPKTIGMAS